MRAEFNTLVRKVSQFSFEALSLSGAISDADADLLICREYPFDQSFDELVTKITNWRDAVILQANIAALEQGESVDLTVFDICTGRAVVVKNDTDGQMLTVKWETVTPCYYCQTIDINKDMSMKYDEIAECRRVYTVDDIKDMLLTEFDYPDGYEDEISASALARYEKGDYLDIDDAIEQSVLQVNDNLPTIYSRLEKKL